MTQSNNRYFLSKTGKSFKIPKNKTLKGDPNDFIEISEEEFTFLKNPQKEEISEIFDAKKLIDNENKETGSNLSMGNVHYKKMSSTEIRIKAKNFDSEGIPNFETANDLTRSISDLIKNSNNEFLSDDATAKESTMGGNAVEIIKMLTAKTKDMVPGKLAIKAESSKRISKMFNLSEKRQKKLVITKKSIKVLQGSLNDEIKGIHKSLDEFTDKISSYNKNIVEFAKVRDDVQDIIEFREEYIQNILEISDHENRTHEQNNFIETFMRETEKVVTLMVDINAYITSTEQRKEIMKINRDASEEVLNNLNRVDTILMPSMIQEYEAYVSNQRLKSSNNVKVAISSAITELTKRNTEQMVENVGNVYKDYGNPVHNIEEMLSRQKELIKIGDTVKDAIRESRKQHVKYLESISLINQSSIKLHKDSGDNETIKEHLQYIQDLKNVE